MFRDEHAWTANRVFGVVDASPSAPPSNTSTSVERPDRALPFLDGAGHDCVEAGRHRAVGSGRRPRRNARHRDHERQVGHGRSLALRGAVGPVGQADGEGRLKLAAVVGERALAAHVRDAQLGVDIRLVGRRDQVARHDCEPHRAQRLHRLTVRIGGADRELRRGLLRRGTRAEGKRRPVSTVGRRARGVGGYERDPQRAWRPPAVRTRSRPGSRSCGWSTSGCCHSRSRAIGSIPTPCRPESGQVTLRRSPPTGMAPGCS